MPSLTKEQRDRELSPLLRKGVEFMPLWACQRHGVDGPALLPETPSLACSLSTWVSEAEHISQFIGIPP